MLFVTQAKDDLFTAFAFYSSTSMLVESKLKVFGGVQRSFFQKAASGGVRGEALTMCRLRH